LDLVTLEAGYISQLLCMHAPACGIGLCAIGEMEFEPVRDLLRVDARYRLLHSLLGGPVEARVVDEAREELVI
jgi:hypothetical protein